MPIEGMKAVLTGEILKTSQLPLRVRKSFPDILSKAMESCELPSVHLSTELLGMQFYHEGRFQTVLDDPAAGLPAALHLMTWLGRQEPRLPTRIAVGLGPVAFLEGRVRLFDNVSRRSFRGGGKAFFISQRLLNVLRTGDRRIGVRTPSVPVNEELEVACLFLDYHIRRWSHDQADSILALLRGETQTETAQAEGISQSAVAQRFRRASGRAVKALMRRYEALLDNNL
jgi:hypothetical protein